DLRGLVTQARLELLAGGEKGQAAANLLAALWASGVSEANPDSWYGSNPISTSSPLWGPDQKVRVSPSKIESVANCPLRWAFESTGATKLSGLTPQVGSLIHSIAEEHPTGTLAELQAELDRRWVELGLKDGWQSAVERKKADGLIRRLALYFQESDGEPIVEAMFNLQVDNAVMAGRVDRIEKIPGDTNSYRIIDFKTGKTIPSAADVEQNPQLLGYQLALAEGAFSKLPREAQTSGADLVFLADGSPGPTSRKQSNLNDQRREMAKQMIRDTADTMAAATFEARVNPSCRSCGVKTSCPIWPVGREVVS
ncbi:MAG: PD-(D/E)XK nuclease family protein, partial [Promicromonosporaceae bacterium]|nr:PD-(D/E)XK nuclease family protein [Promicromonosporaceae bacterium]